MPSFVNKFYTSFRSDCATTRVDLQCGILCILWNIYFQNFFIYPIVSFQHVLTSLHAFNDLFHDLLTFSYLINTSIKSFLWCILSLLQSYWNTGIAQCATMVTVCNTDWYLPALNSPLLLFTNWFHSWPCSSDMLLKKTISSGFSQVRRTVKFLCGVARGIPIVTPQWLVRCKEAGTFVGQYISVISSCFQIVFS